MSLRDTWGIFDCLAVPRFGLWAGRTFDVGDKLVTVVAGEGWHRGVIGIVASKLVDAFYRPAIVLSIDLFIIHRVLHSFTSGKKSGAAGKRVRGIQ